MRVIGATLVGLALGFSLGFLTGHFVLALVPGLVLGWSTPVPLAKFQ